MAIQSFKCEKTRKLFNLERVPKFVNLERIALRKLKQLNLAMTLDDMRVPPDNRLESLDGDRQNQWSIRINDQFRLCFEWLDNSPEHVEIVDYH